MSKPRAVFLDALSLGPVDLAPLERHVELICWPSTPPELRLERLQGAAIAITNKIRLDGELLEQLPQLRLICAASTGTDQIDGQACSELGIAVRNAGRYSTASVVQVTWALILELVCDLQTRRRQVQEGAWQHSPVFALVEPEFEELSGRTLTVLGAGTIGRGVAAVAEAFGMEVRLITSRSGAGELEAALRQADVLSLHAPLNPATRGLLNAERLGWLKPSAVLVNLGRGGLIELPALVEALRRGALAGAALDVLDQEPPGAELDALKELPNLILTPHIGWASRQARQRLVAALAEALESEIGSWG
ncbi:glycerate dehydrogenase [Cyanobium sp. BA20m-p-22]|uniref:NAD(P)-dependent oxidoreductase n=1 Tax=Cyanobium sp. BA20m-p-22 TaxID=2823704 RepID=UPI0020CCD055|nr:NAD(P)-dependent oxidoreductase [Cyanobium sp. BA20m-p-22]MCP9908781.1 glycerate dehydrogenase [Cyanobium sp. BA20m-p-22]